MLFLSRHKKLIFSLLFAIIIAGGIFVWQTEPIRAAGTNSILAGGLISAFSWLLDKTSFIIFSIFGFFVFVAAQLLEAAISIEKFNDIPVVTKGWEITRGLCNMFFALALLIMAFATILRIEKYGMKEYLWKIVVAALLINFSLVIAGVFIDFAQVFTNYFLEAAKGSHTTVGIAGQLVNGLRVMKVTQPPTGIGTAIAQTGNVGFNFILSTVFGSIILMIAAFTLFAAAIFFIVRIPVIWLLLIFSPFAWLSWALPGKAGSLWDKWWNNFLKWVFFAPIYSFFIYLAVFAAGNGQGGGQNSFQQLFSQTQNQIAQSSSAGQVVSTMFQGGMWQIMQYTIIIVILLGGLMVAQQFGIYGANAFMNFAKNTGKFAASGIGGFVQRKLMEGAKDEREGWRGKMRRAGAYLAPDTWKEGWKKRREQKEREARGVATGAAQDMFNRTLSLGKEKTDYKERAQRARIAEEEKDIQSENAEELVAGFKKAEARGNFEKMGAYLKKLARQNDQNELLRDLNDKEGADYSMDAAGMAQFMQQRMVPKMGEQQAYRLGHDVNRIMESNGQWSGRGFRANAATGEYELTGINEQSARDAGVVSKGMTEKEIEAELKKINKEYREVISKKDYNKLDDREKRIRTAFTNTASAYGDIEWSKQDPQVQARTTGRFSYIRETYGPNGQTIDTGLTESGIKKIALISAKHASRMHSHSRAVLMLNHTEKVRDANMGLYNELMDDYVNQTEGMNEPQLENFKKQIKEYSPPLAEETETQREERLDKFMGEIEARRTELKEKEKNKKGKRSNKSDQPEPPEPKPA